MHHSANPPVISAETVVLIASAQDRVQSTCREEIAGDEFQVASCRSGVECLEALRRNAIDVLILDAALPWGGADGILEVLNGPELPAASRPLVFLVTTEVVADLLYRVGRYHVDDFQIGLHDQANLGTRVRRLALQRRTSHCR